MKKLFALVLAVCMLLCFAACGKTEPTATSPAESIGGTSTEAPAAAPEQIEISFVAAQYSDNTEPYLSALCAAYEAEHPNVKINLEVVAWADMAVKWNTMISTNQAPDILNEGSYSAFVEDDLLLPAEEWLSDALKADFFPSFYQYNTASDGTIYAVPLLASVRSMYYNPELLSNAGVEQVPQTWAEVTAACEKIYDTYNGEVYGFGMDFTTASGQENFCYFIWNNGSDFLRDGKWALNSAENVEALQWAVDLYNKGYTNPNPAIETRDDCQKMFAEGKMAMLISANFFPGLYPDMEMGVTPIPHNEGHASVAMGVQDLLMVFDNNYSEAKLAAITDFMDYFYSAENYTEFMLGESMLPATQSGAAYLAEQDETYATYVGILESANFYPSAQPLWDDCKVAVREAMQRALIGDASVQEALDTAQAALENAG